MQERILEIENLKIHFPTEDGLVKAVDGIDLFVHEGETLGIVGESGCGKSVTALAVMGLLQNDRCTREGRILLGDREILQYTDKEMCPIRGEEMAMIFQEPMTSLNPVMKIGRQIDEALLLHSSLDRSATRAKTKELLKSVGIPRSESIVHEYPHQLSGGMRQRVMIAMALACEPSLIIADEPTTALDVTIQAQILDLLRRLKRGNRTSIVFISHDLGVIAEICDRVIVMYAGKIVEEAPVSVLFKNPRHPYTRGLLHSLPSLLVDQERLDCIPGNVPIPIRMPSGCKFFGRCAFRMEKCHLEEPPLLPVGDGHLSRCWLGDSNE